MQIFDGLNENKQEQTMVKCPIYACINIFCDGSFASDAFAIESCASMQNQINNFIKQ